MIYCFKCVACGTQQEFTTMTPRTCVACGATALKRDYQTEWATQSVHIPLHMSSRNTSNKSDFLPTTKDFESPTDPTGEKGMKEWKDTHQRVGFREV